MDISDERALVRARRAEIEYLVHEMSLFESHFNPFTTQVRKNFRDQKNLRRLGFRRGLMSEHFKRELKLTRSP